jgi:aryl-alcohol dehydrogenase-like predicted oxidoreductase
MHNPPIEYLDGNKNDHYEVFLRLIEEGKIKAYGASLDTYDDMKLFMNTTNATVIEAFLIFYIRILQEL